MIIEGMWPNIAANLASEFIIVVLGILFVQFVRNRWDQRLYGGWKVVLKRAELIVHSRDVSVAKAKQVHEMPEELSVFLKGVVSSYVWLNCDLVTEGRTLGMLIEDFAARQWVINLDKNPPSSSDKQPQKG
ncbi:MAG: hypothetical protein HY328_18145 [Chloroflexi bacterium]|nr:hypothetical protein [Chloroflexota bacterium]